MANISDELDIVIPFDTGKEEGYFETVIVSGKFIVIGEGLKEEMIRKQLQ